MKRMVCHVVSTAVAVVAGAVTVGASLKYLKQPESGFDWFVLVLSGLTTGTIAFFITWGHFQGDPEAERPPK
ncbi:MAG: hypothetical protein FWD53_09460 [Phycisphaerales bacterium]|nr:hypothetical protein [Phycisphaerales bacterium]